MIIRLFTWIFHFRNYSKDLNYFLHWASALICVGWNYFPCRSVKYSRYFTRISKINVHCKMLHTEECGLSVDLVILLQILSFFPFSTIQPDHKMLSQFMRQHCVIIHLHYAIDFNSRISYWLFEEDGGDQLETKDAGEEAMERNNWASQNSLRVVELKKEEVTGC